MLNTLAPGAVGAEDLTPEELPFLRFEAEAQELFDGWRADLEHRLRAEEDHPVLLSHLAKYRSLLPPLAAAWCEYLAAHARRLYATVTDAARVAAALLATRLARGRLPVHRARGVPPGVDRADGAPGRSGRARVPRSAGLDSPGGAQTGAKAATVSRSDAD